MSLFTVGHSNHDMATFGAMLTGAGVKILCDVRSKPWSRNPDFTRARLRGNLKEIGIRYLYGGDVLGGFSPLHPEDPMFVVRMHKLLELADEAPTTMMCSEKHPEQCHRAYKLCAWLHRNTDREALHIMPGDVLLPSRAFETTKLQKQIAKYYDTYFAAPVASEQDQQAKLL